MLACESDFDIAQFQCCTQAVNILESNFVLALWDRIAYGGILALKNSSSRRVEALSRRMMGQRCGAEHVKVTISRLCVEDVSEDLWREKSNATGARRGLSSDGLRFQGRSFRPAALL
jgi:hypothetical protein